MTIEILDDEAFQVAMYALSPGEYAAEWRDGRLIVLDVGGERVVAMADDASGLADHWSLCSSELLTDEIGALVMPTVSKS